MQLRALGQSEPIPNSSITTSSIKAGTLRPGNSRNSFQKRFGRASDHCAVDHLSQFATVLVLNIFLQLPRGIQLQVLKSAALLVTGQVSLMIEDKKEFMSVR